MKAFTKLFVLTVLAVVLAGCSKDEQRYVPKSLSDLRGHTVAVNSGTTQERIARLSTEADNVQCMPGGLDALMALNSGRCDVPSVRLQQQ